jgi:hypothetical protein
LLRKTRDEEFELSSLRLKNKPNLTMSQGERLARTLHRIDCPKAKEFTAESLEWLFENQASLPFLEWFCDNISSDNVLTEDELKR